VEVDTEAVAEEVVMEAEAVEVAEDISKLAFDLTD